MNAVTTSSTLRSATLLDEAQQILTAIGVRREAFTYDGPGRMDARSPVNGESIGSVREQSATEVERAIDEAHAAYLEWRHVPAPRRGEFVRMLGDRFRKAKNELG